MIKSKWKSRNQVPTPQVGFTTYFFDADNNGQPTYRISDGSFITTVAGTQEFVIATTYSELVDSKGDWVAGQQYLITDFRTAHYIQFSDSSNNGTGNDEEINLGTVEPIIVTATTDSVLHELAISTLFPQDIIRYKLEPVDRENDYAISQGRGAILYREDVINKLIRFYDFRNFVYRRWNDGNGNYKFLPSQTPPDINDYQDFPPFAVGNKNIRVGFTSDVLSQYNTDNVIFLSPNASIINIGVGFATTFVDEVSVYESRVISFSLFNGRVDTSEIGVITNSVLNNLNNNIIDFIINSTFTGNVGGNVGGTIGDSDIGDLNNSYFNTIEDCNITNISESNIGRITNSTFRNFRNSTFIEIDNVNGEESDIDYSSGVVMINVAMMDEYGNYVDIEKAQGVNFINVCKIRRSIRNHTFVSAVEGTIPVQVAINPTLSMNDPNEPTSSRFDRTLGNVQEIYDNDVRSSIQITSTCSGPYYIENGVGIEFI